MFFLKNSNSKNIFSGCLSCCSAFVIKEYLKTYQQFDSINQIYYS